MALITPVRSDAHPDHTLPKPEQPVDPGYGISIDRPTHPIYLPLPPDAPVDPGYGIDINAPYPDHGLPGDQPHPDHTLPGAQPHPEHPIVLPPDSGGWLPVFIWNQPHPDHGLPTDPHPDHSLPPIPLPEPPVIDGEKMKVSVIWTPADGWQTVVILKPQGPTPTPSKKR